MNNAERCYHKELGLNLKKARKVAGLTQQQLADAIDINRASIVGKEKGRQPISVWELVNVCRICRVAIGDLLPKADIAVTDNIEAMASIPLADRVEFCG